MKKILLAVTTCILSAAAAVAQFEGSFTMTMESAKLKEPMNINVTMKGNLSCMEIPSMASNGFVKSIINREDGSIIMCMERGGNKMGMKTTMKDAERFMPQKENAAPPTFTETNETKTIDGYKCRKVLIESEDSKGDLWITTDLNMNMKDLMNSVSANKSPGSVMLRNFQRTYGDRPGVSLVTHMTNKKTNEEFTMTVNNIKPGKVDEKIFNTDDFHLMDMPNMGGGQIQK